MLSSDLNFTAELTYMSTGMFPIRTSVYLLLITCCYCTVLFDKIFITCRLFCSPLPIEFSCQAVDTKTTKSPLGASTRDIIWVAAPQPVLCWGAAGRDISKGAQYASPTRLTLFIMLLVPINGIRELIQYYITISKKNIDEASKKSNFQKNVYQKIFIFRGDRSFSRAIFFATFPLNPSNFQ